MKVFWSVLTFALVIPAVLFIEYAIDWLFMGGEED